MPIDPPTGRPTVNIGILAHVDAGKTSLTERLLYDTGAVAALGSVDAGTTRTDGTALERRRGITVRAAVAALPVPHGQVNLLDTPGHSEFVAEVERVLDVLDGAVLVVSATDGVQPQTRALMRTLRRMRLPTLIFVNKIDRPGARHAGVLAAIRDRLAPQVVAMTDVTGIGTGAASAVPYDLADAGFAERLATTLAEVDDAVLAALVDGPPPSPARLRAALAARTAEAAVYPVYAGSAITGAGVGALLDAVTALLPAPPPSPPGTEPAGRFFAVRRGPSGENVAYLRLNRGELRPRGTVAFWRPGGAGAVRGSGRVTDLRVVTPSGPAPRVLRPGDIAEIRGLPVRVGDRLGVPDPPGTPDGDPADDPGGDPAGDPGGAPGGGRFAGPGLESVVRAREPGDAGRLHAALRALAERDPLIVPVPGPSGGGGLRLRLYGEVQKEIIAATLAEEFGVAAEFAPSRAVYLERPAGTGAAEEAIGEPLDGAGGGPGDGGRFWATVGLRVSPAPGRGVVFERDTELGALPRAFDRAIEATVRQTLEQGVYGWPVTDCRVALTRSGYASPVSAAGDFRAVTPLVLLRALARAGTAVYEPVHAFELEVPSGALGAVTARLSVLGARVTATDPVPGSGGAGMWLMAGELAARHVHRFQEELPGLSGGDGAWWSRACGDRPVAGRPPVRERHDGDPLNRAAYLRHLRAAPR